MKDLRQIMTAIGEVHGSEVEVFLSAAVSAAMDMERDNPQRWQDKLMVARMESVLAQFTAAGLRYEVIDSQVTLTQNGQVIGA